MIFLQEKKQGMGDAFKQKSEKKRTAVQQNHSAQRSKYIVADDKILAEQSQSHMQHTPYVQLRGSGN